jgi:hypothetical protein
MDFITRGWMPLFMDPTTRVSLCPQDIWHWKAAIAELQARGDGRGEEARHLAMEIREASAEVANLADLVARQKQVSGFYIPPRAVYSRKLAEVRVLESRMEQILALAAAEAAAAATAPVGSGLTTNAPSADGGRWTEEADDDGYTFYYNEDTGESTYDPPAGVKRALAENRMAH